MITLAQHFSFQIIIITKAGFTIKRYVFEPLRFEFHKKLHYILWPINMTQICHILTFPVPSCRPGPIFMVQNGWCRCPAYNTTSFRFNPHLWGVFRPKKSVLSKIATFGCFWGKMMHDFPYKMQTRLVHKSIPAL